MFRVTTVDKSGSARSTEYEQEAIAENEWQSESQRIATGEIIGVGLDKVEQDGTMHPLKAVISGEEGADDVFTKGVEEARARYTQG